MGSTEPLSEAELEALGAIFNNPYSATHVLRRAGFPVSRIPAFQNANIFWREISRNIDDGIMHSGRRRILAEAAKLYPGNTALKEFGAAGSTEITLWVWRNDVNVIGPDGDGQVRVPFTAAQFPPDHGMLGSRFSHRASALGKVLWNTVFSHSLVSLIDQLNALAEEGERVTLRVVPGPDLPAELHWLPWELLNDGKREFLALRKGWSVVRDVAEPVPTRLFTGKDVRTLIVDVSPDADSVVRADVEIETVRRLALGPCETFRGSLDAASDRIRKRRFDIVHVIGTGNRSGLNRLADALKANRRVVLVVLSASDTGGDAEILARAAGVSVVAHRQVLIAPYAEAIAGAFYEELRDRLPVDIAVAESRRALDRRFPGEGAWASLVLVTGWPPPRFDSPTEPQVAVAARTRTESVLDASALRALMDQKNAGRLHDLEADGWESLRKGARSLRGEGEAGEKVPPDTETNS